MSHRNVGVLLLALTACTEPAPHTPFVTQVDGGTPVPDPVALCASTGTLCEAQTPYRCSVGTPRVALPACVGARPVCVAGVGCVACAPGSLRCDPAHPEAPERCADDGSAWEPLPACTGATRCTEGRCGDPCAGGDGARPYLGCEYWATQTPNSQLDPQFPFAVVLGNPQSYAVHVTLSGAGLLTPRTETLDAGEVRAVVLPWVRALVQHDPANEGCRDDDPRTCRAWPTARGARVSRGAYRVQADAPVAAYQFNPLRFERFDGEGHRYASYTNDASLLLSARALTQRYLITTVAQWRPPTQRDGANTFGGFVAITAVSEASTDVTVRLPPGHGVTEAQGDVLRSLALAQGDVVLVVGSVDGDLSGAIVEASAPVAVFAGHDCAQVPVGRAACDHLEEQLLPMESLGREYVIGALRDRAMASLVRVVSPYDTTLRFDPPSLHSAVELRAREVFQLATSQSFRVSATRPVAVMQFMFGQGTSADQNGDPAMAQEVPAQQYRDRYDFLTPDTYTHNYVSLVVPRGAHVRLDGAALVATPDSVGPWEVLHAPVAPGRHTLRTDEGVPFGLKVYGTARYTSYMAPGGLDLRLLPPG